MSVRKDEAYKNLSKKEYELEETRSELRKAKEIYRETLIQESIRHILGVIEEEGAIDERGLQIFLGDLSLKTKQLYNKE